MRDERKGGRVAFRRYRFSGRGLEDDQARLQRRSSFTSTVFLTRTRSRRKKRSNSLRLLADYQLQAKLYLVPFAEIQRHIMVDTPIETRVILYRRYMMRLAEQIARRERARVLVTGDSVGQVASQTIENIDVISRAVRMPILRPLIGDDKLEIVESARRIGTYEISIQPDQDCCSLFVPKHPETRANLVRIERSEAVWTSQTP